MSEPAGDVQHLEKLKDEGWAIEAKSVPQEDRSCMNQCHVVFQTLPMSNLKSIKTSCCIKVCRP